MMTPDWYFAQAGLFRQRADACTDLAGRLEGAALFDLAAFSGEATWIGPVATEFDRQLSVHRRRLQDAIDALRTNALGLSGDADDYERQGAYLAAQQQETG